MFWTAAEQPSRYPRPEPSSRNMSAPLFFGSPTTAMMTGASFTKSRGNFSSHFQPLRSKSFFLHTSLSEKILSLMPVFVMTMNSQGCWLAGDGAQLPASRIFSMSASLTASGWNFRQLLLPLIAVKTSMLVSFLLCDESVLFQEARYGFPESVGVVQVGRVGRL